MRWLPSMMLLGPLLTAGCGAVSRPAPTFVPQPRTAYVTVPYPPPPARVEIAPQSPREGAVWLGGEWDFRFRRWIWTYGRWVVPPSGGKYARWSLRRDDKGEMHFAPGSWRDAVGARLESPDPLARGRARENAVVEEDGTRQPVGPNNPLAPPPPAD